MVSSASSSASCNCLKHHLDDGEQPNSKRQKCSKDTDEKEIADLILELNKVAPNPPKAQPDWKAEWIADPRAMMSALPTIFLEIFPKELATCIVPYLQVDLEEADKDEEKNMFGVQKWEKHYGTVTKAPQPLRPSSQSAFLETVWQNGELRLNADGNARYFFYYMPTKVAGKELTPSHMATLAEEPRAGNKTDVWWWHSVEAIHGNKAVEQAYYGLIPTGFDPADILGRDKEFKDQKGLIPAGSEIPSIIDPMVANLGKYAWKGIRTYGEEPRIYVRCIEQIPGGQVAVGGFDLNGLSVNEDTSGGPFAVVGIWKFFFGPRSSPT